LKHFSLLERAKIGASAKKYAASISVALAPIFAPPKSEKRLERAENATEMLATQARLMLITEIVLMHNPNSLTIHQVSKKKITSVARSLDTRFKYVA